MCFFDAATDVAEDRRKQTLLGSLAVRILLNFAAVLVRRGLFVGAIPRSTRLFRELGSISAPLRVRAVH